MLSIKHKEQILCRNAEVVTVTVAAYIGVKSANGETKISSSGKDTCTSFILIMPKITKVHLPNVSKQQT